MSMNESKHSCELPVMKGHCKTCPFKRNEQGFWQNPELAEKVISRTLFKGQQICHGTEGDNREPTHRCRGSYDYNKFLYDCMGMGNLISEEAMPIEKLSEKVFG